MMDKEQEKKFFQKQAELESEYFQHAVCKIKLEKIKSHL